MFGCFVGEVGKTVSGIDIALILMNSICKKSELSHPPLPKQRTDYPPLYCPTILSNSIKLTKPPHIRQIEAKLYCPTPKPPKSYIALNQYALPNHS